MGVKGADDEACGADREHRARRSESGFLTVFPARGLDFGLLLDDP